MSIEKTQAIIWPFDNRKRRNPSMQFTNGDHVIPIQKSVKYLVIVLDKKLNYAQHIEEAVNKANKCFRAFFNLLAPKSKLSLENKRLLYTAAIRPILCYGCSIWSLAAKQDLSKMIILQNKILQTLFCLHRRFPTSLLQNHRGVEHLMNFINRFNSNFNVKCSVFSFELIRALNY